MLKIAVNDLYPLHVSEGMRVGFLAKEGNIMQIGLPGIDKQEQLAFKKGIIKCGLFVRQPVILWLFDFGEAGQYDAPINAKLYDSEQLNLPNIEKSEQRLAIEMHVVDLNDNTLKALRLFTLPPELTIEFLSAVQDQLSLHFSNADYQAKLENIYQIPVDQLIATTKLYKAGT